MRVVRFWFLVESLTISKKIIRRSWQVQARGIQQLLLTSFNFQSHTPRVHSSNISHQAGVHSCITECQAVDFQLWPQRTASTVGDPPALPKKKHTSILLPADIWSRDASEGAHQFKVVSLSVSRWCWQVHYSRLSCEHKMLQVMQPYQSAAWLGIYNETVATILSQMKMCYTTEWMTCLSFVILHDQSVYTIC